MHLPSLLANVPKATRFSSDAWMDGKEQLFQRRGKAIMAFIHGKQG
jgi:hypothetical protein